jgi:zinc protease
VKKWSLGALGLLALVVAHAGAQVDTGTTSFEVNGIRVILRRNTANDVIAANVYLLGGSQQLTPATQGIESLLLRASERGTKRYPGDRVRQAL